MEAQPISIFLVPLVIFILEVYIYIYLEVYIYLYVRDFKAKTEGLRKLLKMLKTLTPLNQELYQYFMIYNISFVQYCFCFLHMEQVNNIYINK